MQPASTPANLIAKQNTARSTCEAVYGCERGAQLILRRSVVTLLSAVALLLGGGCTITPQLAVNIDAIDSGQAVQDARYVLKPVVKGVDESDLHFAEYSRHIDNALQKHGMTRVDSVDEANVQISVNYGIKSRQRALLRHSVLDDPFYYERRCRHRHKGQCLHRYPSRFYDHNDWFYGPRRRQVDVLTSYSVFVSLEARLIDTDTAKPVLWTTRARARFAKPDLRVTLPLLLVAAEDFIGVDTGRERTVILRGDELAIASSKK